MGEAQYANLGRLHFRPPTRIRPRLPHCAAFTDLEGISAEWSGQAYLTYAQWMALLQEPLPGKTCLTTGLPELVRSLQHRSPANASTSVTSAMSAYGNHRQGAPTHTQQTARTTSSQKSRWSPNKTNVLSTPYHHKISVQLCPATAPQTP